MSRDDTGLMLDVASLPQRIRTRRRAISSPQCGAPPMPKEQTGRENAVSICSMEALSLPQNRTPPTPKQQPASRGAVSICSMEALSLPQNGTPPTPKQQPASRGAVSICSMEAAPFFEMEADEAASTLVRMIGTIAERWRGHCRAAGMTGAEVKHDESAFDPEETRRARRLVGGAR